MSERSSSLSETAEELSPEEQLLDKLWVAHEGKHLAKDVKAGILRFLSPVHAGNVQGVKVETAEFSVVRFRKISLARLRPKMQHLIGSPSSMTINGTYAFIATGLAAFPAAFDDYECSDHAHLCGLALEGALEAGGKVAKQGRVALKPLETMIGCLRDAFAKLGDAFRLVFSVESLVRILLFPGLKPALKLRFFLDWSNSCQKDLLLDSLSDHIRRHSNIAHLLPAEDHVSLHSRILRHILDTSAGAVVPRKVDEAVALAGEACWGDYIFDGKVTYLYTDASAAPKPDYLSGRLLVNSDTLILLRDTPGEIEVEICASLSEQDGASRGEEEQFRLVSATAWQVVRFPTCDILLGPQEWAKISTAVQGVAVCNTGDDGGGGVAADTQEDEKKPIPMRDRIMAFDSSFRPCAQLPRRIGVVRPASDSPYKPARTPSIEPMSAKAKSQSPALSTAFCLPPFVQTYLEVLGIRSLSALVRNKNLGSFCELFADVRHCGLFGELEDVRDVATELHAEVAGAQGRSTQAYERSTYGTTGTAKETWIAWHSGHSQLLPDYRAQAAAGFSVATPPPINELVPLIEESTILLRQSASTRTDPLDLSRLKQLDAGLDLLAYICLSAESIQAADVSRIFAAVAPLVCAITYHLETDETTVYNLSVLIRHPLVKAPSVPKGTLIAMEQAVLEPSRHFLKQMRLYGKNC